ncbi:hypothetical protein Q5H92_13630 [Hymenobacter sp. M29]|uniref:Glycosyltransferase RgtA/B/C/D-like domain-containing protein n=1 Tax=Hymenobacter mellowenesis TaxID=3063995 RepID=A0ABT9AC39_9BACT|nr:hypothetical protein [Hymenobacter sp. M29]MDO7847405.1 hypothetical protein [Hymenobacter sp. M29]
MISELALLLIKLAVAIGVNALFLLWLLPWVARQWREATGWWRGAFAVGLGLRLGTGLAKNWHLKLDANYMSSVGDVVTEQLWLAPLNFLQMLTQSVTVLPNVTGKYLFVYQSSSNTWNLAKILSLLNLGSLGCAQVNSLYLSVFTFVGCWMLVRALATCFPATPAGAGVVALLLWPSVWFWAAGISKEAVLLGSGAWLTARVFAWLYAGEAPASAPAVARGGGWWVGTAALAVLHVAMRYFFALPLLAVLAGLAVGRGLERLLPRRWAAVLGVVAVFGVGAWVGPEISVAFRLNKFVYQVIKVYSYDVAQSADRPHFEYPDLRPTASSIAAHAPRAVANVFTQPWPGQSRQPLYLAAGLENAVLLLLLALAVWALVRGRGGHLPFSVVFALGVFCVLLAFLIGITTPNLGSLHRYRSTLLPFLLLLLLQNDYAAGALRRLVSRMRPFTQFRPARTPNA